MQIKFTLMTLWALIASLLLLSGCSPDPQKDIALFQPFIDANINKVSDDPYISSTLKPNDKFYDILVNLQHGRHDKAETRLLELMDQGNLQAQYWYARLINGSSVKETPIALRLLKQVAAKNDPYALFSLSPKGGECMIYYGKRNCTEDNFNKAVEVFKVRAQQGDLRAQYFLLRMFKPDGSRIRQQYYFTGGMGSLLEDSYYLYHSDETRALFIKEIIRFAEGHYYQPLMDYVNYRMKEDENNEIVFDSPQARELVLQLLTIAANNNYTPAMKLYVILQRKTISPNHPFFKKGVRLGCISIISQAIVTFKYLDVNPHQNSFPLEQSYYYKTLRNTLSGSRSFEEVGEFKKMDTNVKQKLDEQLAETLHTMTPMIHIDAFTPRNKWMEM